MISGQSGADNGDQPRPRPSGDLDLIGPTELAAYDDLFLAQDRRGRRKRSRRLSDKQPAGARHLQTIYFGGFFPWLVDEAGGGAQRRLGQSSSGKPSIRQHQRKLGESKQDNVSAGGGQQQVGSPESRHQLGRFILPAVRLALDHINNNHSVLGAYKLEVVPRDTQVSQAGASRKGRLDNVEPISGRWSD